MDKERESDGLMRTQEEDEYKKYRELLNWEDVSLRRAIRNEFSCHIQFLSFINRRHVIYSSIHLFDEDIETPCHGNYVSSQCSGGRTKR